MRTGIIGCVKSALPLVIVGACLALVCGLSACGSDEASSEDLTESLCAPAISSLHLVAPHPCCTPLLPDTFNSH